MDPTVLGGREGLLAEFDETVLARETLPTLGGNPGRIDASGRATRSVASWAVRRRAIPCSWYPQSSGHRDLFGSVRQACGDVGVSAYRSGGSSARRTVGGPARVVDHVGPRVLESRRIRLNNIPAEQRENLVEARVTG